MAKEPQFLAAVTVYHKAQKNTVWCFDLPEQFALAVWHLNRHGVPHRAHHALNRTNGAFRLSNACDSVWLELSGGFNDHEELLNCLGERGELN